MVSVVDDSREGTVVGSMYDGCSKFEGKRVIGQYVYAFWTWHPNNCSWYKRNGVI